MPEFNKFYTSNAGDNTSGVVDVHEMKVVKKLRTERKADGSAYAAPFHKLYVSDERGKAEAVVDLAVDAETRRVYTPEQEENGKPAARMIVYDAVTGK